LSRRLLRRQLVLGGSGLQLLQLQLHLLQQPVLALRAVAINCPPELLDLQPEMSDQRLRAGVHRLGFQTGGALGEDHRMRGGKIGRKRGCHPAKES